MEVNKRDDCEDQGSVEHRSTLKVDCWIGIPYRGISSSSGTGFRTYRRRHTISVVSLSYCSAVLIRARMIHKRPSDE